jgi:hypothetical protein
MKHDLVQGTNNLFSCLRADLGSKRQVAIAQAQDGIAKMGQSADTLKANGVDPSALNVVMDGVSKPLTTAITDMQSKVVLISQQFDEAAAQLDKNEKDAVAKITAN